MIACEQSLEGYKARASKLLSLLHSLPTHKLSPSALSRLFKLINSELRFLHTHPEPPLNSSNLGYLEAVVQVLQHPHVDSVSAVLHTFRSNPNVDTTPEAVRNSPRQIEAHVDVVCIFNAKPVWIVVSDRNPKYLHWSHECNQVKGWKCRVQELCFVARSLCVLRPASVLFCFARGVPGSVKAGFEGDTRASLTYMFEEQKDALKESCLELGGMLSEKDDGDWVCIYVSTDRAHLDGWITFQVNISTSLDGVWSLEHRALDSQACEERRSLEDLHLHGVEDLSMRSKEKGDTFLARKPRLEGNYLHEGTHSHGGACNDSFISCLAMICRHSTRSTPFEISSFPMPNIVNLDTTALIALVSEVSNGAASTLVNMSTEDLVFKFKSTAQFMKDQAVEELRCPLMKRMTDIFEFRSPFISETVCKEFKSLVLLCGSFKEKVRAEELLRAILVVPDTPSMRVRSLHETGKIKDKNKVIFGTGDFWQAPTLTANMSFVRALRQTGMALSILEHQPRALVGEKCS